MTDARWQRDGRVPAQRRASRRPDVDYAQAWTLDDRARREGAALTASRVRAIAAPVVAVAGVAKTLPRPARARSRRSTSPCAAASSSRCSGRPAAARRRCCNLIAGLVAPTAGTLRWWGGGSRRPATPGAGSAMVFQSPTLMPWARVDANVRLPLDLARRAARDAPTRGRAPRSRCVGLADFARHYPRELSGGMQMRVSIARALVTAPRPAADGRAVRRARRVHAAAARRRAAARCGPARGLTVVFVTHSIARGGVPVDARRR